mmetsp:Transcript_19689/g.34932  ORF Transcript_19689/g.34932 Transcript_19689/m.34932 type:complete len:229 (+) Transcript_19689:835-1521(+)
MTIYTTFSEECVCGIWDSLLGGEVQLSARADEALQQTCHDLSNLLRRRWSLRQQPVAIASEENFATNTAELLTEALVVDLVESLTRRLQLLENIRTVCLQVASDILQVAQVLRGYLEGLLRIPCMAILHELIKMVDSLTDLLRKSWHCDHQVQAALCHLLGRPETCFGRSHLSLVSLNVSCNRFGCNWGEHTGEHIGYVLRRIECQVSDILQAGMHAGQFLLGEVALV